jgi:hypothetical protein
MHPTTNAARIMMQPAVRILAVVLVVGLCAYRWAPSLVRLPVMGLAAAIWIYFETGGLARMGLRWPIELRRTLGWSLLCFLLVAGVITPLVEPWLAELAGEPVDYSGYGALEGNLPAALALVGRALLSAVIAEELVFRGFLLHQFDALLGSRRWAPLVAVLVAAAIFGAMHWPQGWVGMVVTGLAGAVFGSVFFLAGRNLWAVMLAHAWVDIWGVATLYFAWY